MHVFQHFNKLKPKEQGRVRSSIRVTELEAPRERAETEVLSTETFFSKTLFFSEIYCWITAAMNSRNRIYNTAVSINSRKNRRSARKCKNEHQVTVPARKGLSTSLEEPAYTSSEVDKYQLGTIYYLPGPARRIQTCLEDTVTYQSELITNVSRKYIRLDISPTWNFRQARIQCCCTCISSDIPHSVGDIPDRDLRTYNLIYQSRKRKTGHIPLHSRKLKDREAPAPTSHKGRLLEFTIPCCSMLYIVCSFA